MSEMEENGPTPQPKQTESVPMFDQEQYDMLKDYSSNRTQWDHWQDENPGKPILLSGADFEHVDLQQTNLAHADLRGAILADANLQNADLRGADLQEANLWGADLQGANLQGAELRGAKLNQTNLCKAELRGVNLHGAKLAGVNLHGAKLAGVDLRGADLVHADLVTADLRHADLQGANLADANLQEADLRDANLQKADLHSADLQKADLRGAKVEGARLNWTNLRRANLSGVNLTTAELEGVHLRMANLYDANLAGVNLQEINLGSANLHRADLSGANLHKAILAGANLREAHLLRVCLTETNCRMATVDGSTLIGPRKYDRRTDFTGVGLGDARIKPGVKQLLEYNIRRLGWERWYRGESERRWKILIRQVTTLPVRLFWGISNYGLSTARILAVFFGFAFAFAVVYMVLAEWCPPGAVEKLEVDPFPPLWQYRCVQFLRPIYFSIVTMTTLGFGDMYAHPERIDGYILLMMQVLLGYILLAALVTRLAVLFTAGGPAARFPKPEREGK